MCRCLKIGLLLCIAVAVFFFGRFFLFDHMGRYIYEKDALKPADVIVVLPGRERERVEYAAKLFKDEWSRKDRIIMSGGPLVWKYTAAGLMKLQAESLGIPGKNILLEDRSSNTAQEAEYTGEILHKHGYRSIILVTSPYQSRMAAEVFRKVMGKRIRVICAPVEDSWFKFEDWWRRPRERDVVLKEYVGLIRFWIFGTKQETPPGRTESPGGRSGKRKDVANTLVQQAQSLPEQAPSWP